MSEEQLAAAIERLIARYKGDIKAKQTREILSDCIKGLGGLFAQPTTTTQKRRQYYFRARRASSFRTEEEAVDPSQYSYVPATDCTNMGRCHIPGHPVFYGSSNFETAVLETKADGEMLVIALWISPPTTITYQNFLCGSNAEGYVKSQKAVITDGLDKQYSHYDDFNRNRIRAHCAAWSDLFLGSEDEYALSASIAHQMLYGQYGARNIDSICYGSVVDPKHLNYALHTRYASKLELYRVYACYPTDIPNYFNYSKCGDIDDTLGILAWRDMLKTDLPENDPNIPGEPIFSAT